MRARCRLPRSFDRDFNDARRQTRLLSFPVWTEKKRERKRTHKNSTAVCHPLMPPLVALAGQRDLVEVSPRQLSYHIGPPLVSSGPSSALLAPDRTKNAGNISLFEPPSATTLTKGPLLILDHIYSHPCPLVQTPTGPSSSSHLPLTSTLQKERGGRGRERETSSPKAKPS